jgi:hypothetical protein
MAKNYTTKYPLFKLDHHITKTIIKIIQSVKE